MIHITYILLAFSIKTFVIKIHFFEGLLFYAPKWSFCIWPDANRKRTLVSWSNLVFVTSLRDGRYYHCGKSQQSTPARDLGTLRVFVSQDALGFPSKCFSGHIPPMFPRYFFKQNEWLSLFFPLCHFPNCPQWRTMKKFTCKTHIISIQQRSQQLRYTNPKQKKTGLDFSTQILRDFPTFWQLLKLALFLEAPPVTNKSRKNELGP